MGEGANSLASAGATSDAASERSMEDARLRRERRPARQQCDDTPRAVTPRRSVRQPRELGHVRCDRVDATKSVVDGLFNGAITDKDADEKMHEASAARFKRIADDAHDNEKDAKALLNKALDFYKEYVDTKNQTAMAAMHRA